MSDILTGVVPGTNRTISVNLTAMERDLFLESDSMTYFRNSSIPLYRNNLKALKSRKRPIICGRCAISITENTYVSYCGYCPDCLYEVNKPKDSK